MFDVPAEAPWKAAMIDSLVNLLFGCRHRRMSLPMSPRSEPGAPAGDAFTVCLDCGKRIAYDLKRMRVKAVEDPADGPPNPVSRNRRSS